MARLVAAAIVSVAAILFLLVPAIDERIILFAFFLGIMIVLSNIEAKLNRKWTYSLPQRIMEYEVKALGLSDDNNGLELWLTQLNNERWELVAIFPSPKIDGMYYGVFARPKRLEFHN
jgi:hypothetical protein